ncbi:hypothetical protein HY483_00235 [Candidatus Woesearchaeota archaeon]|nr:hypothetical protein [Candidatus Woesearchaeota archaeon]
MSNRIIILIVLTLLMTSAASATLQESLETLKEKVSDYEQGEINYLQLQIYAIETRNEMNKELGLNAYTIQDEDSEEEQLLDETEEEMEEVDIPDYLDELESHFEKVEELFEKGDDKKAEKELMAAEELLKKNGKTKSAELVRKMIDASQQKDYSKMMKYAGELERIVTEEIGLPEFDEKDKDKSNESRKEKFSKRFEGVSSEALKRVFGEPTRLTDWLWNANEEKSERTDSKLPEWEKTIHDGEKIKLVLRAHPNVITINGERTTFYWTNLEVRFKRKISFEPSQIISNLKSLSDIKELAGESASAEQQLNQYLQDNREQCFETLKELFPEANIREEEQERADVTIASNEKAEMRLNMNRCLNCEQTWLWFGVNAWGNTKEYDDARKIEGANTPRMIQEPDYESARQKLPRIAREVVNTGKEYIETPTEAKFNNLFMAVDEMAIIREELQQSASRNDSPYDKYTFDDFDSDVTNAFENAGLEIKKYRVVQTKYQVQIRNETEEKQNRFCRGEEKTQCSQEEYCSEAQCKSALGGREICENGEDDDDDGRWDCGDPDCYSECRENRDRDREERDEKQKVEEQSTGQQSEQQVQETRKEAQQESPSTNTESPPITGGAIAGQKTLGQALLRMITGAAIGLGLVEETQSNNSQQSNEQSSNEQSSTIQQPQTQSSGGGSSNESISGGGSGQQNIDAGLQNGTGDAKNNQQPKNNNQNSEQRDIFVPEEFNEDFNNNQKAPEPKEWEQPQECRQEWCKANQECRPERQWCECTQGYYDCDGDWINGCESTQQCKGCQTDADCAPTRCSEDKQRITTFQCVQEGSWREDKAVVFLESSCEKTPSGEINGWVNVNGWGTAMQDFYKIKEGKKEYKDGWCLQQLENAQKQRKEIENTFNKEFLQWYFQQFREHPEEFEKYERGISELFHTTITQNADEIARAEACSGEKVEVTPITIGYEDEYGKIDYWEEQLPRPDLDNQIVITPFMKRWFYPTRETMKFMIKKGPPPEEREKGFGPPPQEIREMRRLKPVMDTIRKISERFDGSADIAITINDGEEILNGMVLTISPKELVRGQFINDSTITPDVTVTLDYNFLYDLISTNVQKFEGQRVETAWWVEEQVREERDEGPGAGTIIKIILRIIEGVVTGDVKITPVSRYDDVLLSAKDIVSLMMKAQAFGE